MPGDAIFVGATGVESTTACDIDKSSRALYNVRCHLPDPGTHVIAAALQYANDEAIEPVDSPVQPGKQFAAGHAAKTFWGALLEGSPFEVEQRNSAAEAAPEQSCVGVGGAGRWRVARRTAGPSRKRQQPPPGAPLEWLPRRCRLGFRNDRTIAEWLTARRVARLYFLGDSILRWFAIDVAKNHFNGELKHLSRSTPSRIGNCTVLCGAQKLSLGGGAVRDAASGRTLEYYAVRGIYSESLQRAAMAVVHGVCERASSAARDEGGRAVLVFNSGLHDVASAALNGFAPRLRTVLSAARECFPGTVVWQSTTDTHMRTTAEYIETLRNDTSSAAKSGRQGTQQRKPAEWRDYRPMAQLNLMTRERISRLNVEARTVCAELRVKTHDVFGATRACWTPECMRTRSDIRHYKKRVSTEMFRGLLAMLDAYWREGRAGGHAVEQ